MLISFLKKNVGQRTTTSFHPAIRARFASSAQQCIKKKKFKVMLRTSSPKGNDAHLRVIKQSEKKWKHQFFRRLRAANSVVRGRIWPNFKLIQALMYVIITC